MATNPVQVLTWSPKFWKQLWRCWRWCWCWTRRPEELSDVRHFGPCQGGQDVLDSEDSRLPAGSRRVVSSKERKCWPCGLVVAAAALAASRRDVQQGQRNFRKCSRREGGRHRPKTARPMVGLVSFPGSCLHARCLYCWYYQHCIRTCQQRPSLLAHCVFLSFLMQHQCCFLDHLGANFWQPRTRANKFLLAEV